MDHGSSDNSGGRFLGKAVTGRHGIQVLSSLPPQHGPCAVHPASLPRYQARFAHPPPSDKNLPHHVPVDSTGHLIGAILSDEIMTAPC